MSTTEVPSTLPGNVSLADHDPDMFDLIEKEKVRSSAAAAVSIETAAILGGKALCFVCVRLPPKRVVEESLLQCRGFSHWRETSEISSVRW